MSPDFLPILGFQSDTFYEACPLTNGDSVFASSCPWLFLGEVSWEPVFSPFSPMARFTFPRPSPVWPAFPMGFTDISFAPQKRGWFKRGPMPFLIKTLVSAVLLTIIAEVAKRNIFLGGLLASLPLTTYGAIFWLYADTHNVEKIADLSMSVFWLVLPSLVFFPCLAFLLTKARWSFFSAMGTSTALMGTAYLAMTFLLKRISLIK
jgi:uncharacterized membrane protein (GlpM family)